MKLGINLTKKSDLALTRSLFEAGQIDYCEILIDNFWFWSAADLRETFRGIPVSFHVMHSEVVENPLEKVDLIADRLKFFSDILHPIYISDHLARFSQDGRPFALLQEVAYITDFDMIVERLDRYQRAVGQKILFENFPSMQTTNEDQIQFFEKAQQQADLQILFDVSNAVVSRINGNAHETDWASVYRGCRNFHIGGYRLAQGEQSLVIDSHDTPVGDFSLSFLKEIVNTRLDTKDQTLTVEWDHHISTQNFVQDLIKVRECCK